MRRQPEFKQKPLAIAFTVGIHAVVLVGLAFFADAPLPEPPKPLKTVLITPEQLKLRRLRISRRIRRHQWQIGGIAIEGAQLDAGKIIQIVGVMKLIVIDAAGNKFIA